MHPQQTDNINYNLLRNIPSRPVDAIRYIAKETVKEKGI